MSLPPSMPFDRFIQQIDAADRAFQASQHVHSVDDHGEIQTSDALTPDELIANYQARIKDLTQQRDDALEQVEGFEALKQAVWAYFHMLESPTPQIRERAVDDLRDCARSLGIVS